MLSLATLWICEEKEPMSAPQSMPEVLSKARWPWRPARHVRNRELRYWLIRVEQTCHQTSALSTDFARAIKLEAHTVVVSTSRTEGCVAQVAALAAAILLGFGWALTAGRERKLGLAVTAVLMIPPPGSATRVRAADAVNHCRGGP